MRREIGTWSEDQVVLWVANALDDERHVAELYRRTGGDLEGDLMRCIFRLRALGVPASAMLREARPVWRHLMRSYSVVK